jgi:hypothetical protein
MHHPSSYPCWDQRHKYPKQEAPSLESSGFHHGHEQQRGIRCPHP